METNEEKGRYDIPSDQEQRRRLAIMGACADLKRKYARLYSLPKGRFNDVLAAALVLGKRLGDFHEPVILPDK